MSRGSQEQEFRVTVVPREVMLRQQTCAAQVQSQHQQWILDEKAAQREHWMTAEQAVSSVSGML